MSNPDQITQADIAAGYKVFREGWLAGAAHNVAEIQQLARKRAANASELELAIYTLVDQHLADGELLEREICAADDDSADAVFDEDEMWNCWRKLHPHDPTSPEWEP